MQRTNWFSGIWIASFSGKGSWMGKTMITFCWWCSFPYKLQRIFVNEFQNALTLGNMWQQFRGGLLVFSLLSHLQQNEKILHLKVVSTWAEKKGPDTISPLNHPRTSLMKIKFSITEPSWNIHRDESRRRWCPRVRLNARNLWVRSDFNIND